MKLLTFRDCGEPRLGRLLEDGATVVDLTATGSPLLASMLTYLDGGDEAGEAAAATSTPTRPLSEVTLLAPLPRPRSVRDCMVFERHIVQATRAVTRWKMGRFEPLARPFLKLSKVWYEQPIYYKSNRFSVVGPDAEVRMPAGTQKFDYELEWAAVIGREGHDLPRERAFEHIAGFTIFDDFTARDNQIREMTARLGPAKGKDFDTGNAIGPYLVTPDEVADPYDLTMVARVNGEEWSRGTTADMYHRWEDVLVHLSRDETLYPGELIGSGAVGGGCGLELDRFLSPGDVVELEVEGLGVLRNRVVAAGSDAGA
jgi:2-keto-4-pentenoate hydratase/2-oxohepta-3-ene-1,7-dioic acid hydratase in catechol pathway